MALNYDVAIKCLDEAGNSIGDVKIHAYFIQVDSGSSLSTWDSSIRLTNGAGSTSFNLGDSSFLGSEGLIKTGDKILITAWLTDNIDTTIDDKSNKAPGITRCVNFIHTVDTSSSTWSETFTVFNVTPPVCNITIPTVTNTGHTFTVLNSSTVNEGPFTDPNNARTDLYQNLISYSQNLFLGLEIEKTVYDYIENTYTETGIIDNSYTYIDAGDYTISVRPYNFLGFFCEVTKAEHILYNKPTINFDYTFTKLLNSDKHIGVGNDDELKTTQLSTTNFGDTWTQLQATFDWTLTDTNLDGTDNTSTYTAQDETFKPTKLYNTEGSKNITLTINWNDGFTAQQEVLTLNPFLDTYNITLDFNWSTQKNYVDIYPVPLGDDDLVTINNLDFDSSTQNYNSTSQYSQITWNITKKKNDGTDDSETFVYSPPDSINTSSSFYIKYLHKDTDLAKIEQILDYWDGYKSVTKNLIKELRTQNYIINQDFHWNTEFYGLNKVVTQDNDSVTLYNDTYFTPQNNVNIVTQDQFLVQKDKYTSYTDSTIIDDSETFTFQDLTGNPNFFIRKEGDYTITDTINYYDGYQSTSSILSKTILAKPLIPIPDFKWVSRYGENTYIEGRDDLCTYTNLSTVKDYYGTIKAYNSVRSLKIDWTINNFITSGNFSNSTVIGGGTFSSDDSNIMTFLDSTIDFQPQINYWTALVSQDSTLKYYFNDGYFNRDSSITKQIETKPYLDLVPGATYTSLIPDRVTSVIFRDNSTEGSSSISRIIDIDWSLTDAYDSNSMNIDLRGTDNLQTWLNQSKDTEITTTINNPVVHTLSQDTIRWDDGFKLKTFSNSYSINTTVYTINPDFSYYQKYVTGPEIVFSNTTTVNGNAVQLSYDLEIQDTFNDGTDAFTAYRNIPVNNIQEHTYKSVSNSPFEVDTYNKDVTIFVDYDDGWNEVYDSYNNLILVKPNRIVQDFVTNPIRHPSDTGTDDKSIIGNNPIEFYDNSTTERIDDAGDKDFSFIKGIEFSIIDTCS